MQIGKSAITQSYNGIDATKFLMAVLVVILHSNPWKDTMLYFNYVWTQGITRVAVPFFFLTAGFLLFRRMSADCLDWGRIRKYCLRIIRVYLVWTGLYLPLIIWSIFRSSSGWFHELLLEVQKIFVTGSYFHLWFLPQLVVATLLTAYFFQRRWVWWHILFLAACFHSIALLGSGYYPIFKMICPSDSASFVFVTKYLKMIFNSPINGVTEGFLFVLLGALLGFRERLQFHMGTLAVCTILSWVLFACEHTVVYANWGMQSGTAYIMLVPVTISTFLFAKNVGTPGHWIYLDLRRMSMFVYYVHPWFLFLWGWVGKHICLSEFTVFFFGLISSVLLAAIITRLSNRWKILKILY